MDILDGAPTCTHIRVWVEEKFPESVAALKAELKRLEGDLRTADASGNRSIALNILARMLQLQKKFRQSWSKQPVQEQAEPQSEPPPEPNASGRGR